MTSVKREAVLSPVERARERCRREGTELGSMRHLDAHKLFY
jgi:hypothetical protein